MFLTKLKEQEMLLSLPGNRIFLLLCHGCREIGFPDREAAALEAALRKAGRVKGSLTTNYICSPERLALCLKAHRQEIEESDCVLVFSCGVGVQTAASLIEQKPVYAACDTVALPGFQGVTPLEVDCGQCGACLLNLTDGICPVTACTKGLLNGPCGGAKNGKCEADPEMDCGWEMIFRRLEQLGKTDVLRYPVRLYDPLGGQAESTRN